MKARCEPITLWDAGKHFRKKNDLRLGHDRRNLTGFSAVRDHRGNFACDTILTANVHSSLFALATGCTGHGDSPGQEERK